MIIVYGCLSIFAFRLLVLRKKTLLKLCIFVLQVSTSNVKFPKQAPPTLILSSHNIPSKEDWNLAVNRALQMIEQHDSSLTKVTTSHAFSLSDFESFLVLQETI